MKKAFLLLSGMCFCLSLLGADAPQEAQGLRLENLDASHYLGGWQVAQDDLEGLVLLIIRFPVNSIPSKDDYSVISRLRRNQDAAMRFLELCSVTGERKSLDMYERLVAKSSVRIIPAYEGLDAVSGADGKKDASKYVVVGHDGKVIHRGDNATKAVSFVRKALKAQPPSDPHFGIVAPVKNHSVTNLVAEGKSLAPAYAALRKAAAGKDAEAAAEAKKLMAALDQTMHLRLASALRAMGTAPGHSSILLERTLKMWPKAKNDSRVAYMTGKFKQIDALPKIVNAIGEYSALSAIDPETAKPSELKKARAAAAALKAKVAKLKVSAKANSVKTEAARLEEAVAAVMMKLGCE